MTEMHPIETIINQAKTQQWPYPQTFEALKTAGVYIYRVDLSPFLGSYHGKLGVWRETNEGLSVSVSPHFDSDKVVVALRRTQNKETNYAQFLNEIAAAGITYYVVSMVDRTVSYHGEKQGQVYKEEVPVWGQ